LFITGRLSAALAFRDAFKRHRCLIPATGFYEWKKVEAGKQPSHIGMIDTYTNFRTPNQTAIKNGDHVGQANTR